MTQELKDKWLAALRSGKYEQGDGCLRSHDAYCCLGVLADVIDPNGWDTSAGIGHYWHENDIDLPAEILLPTVQADLAIMNDDGETFSEIADWIEALVKARP